jgi:hypothetical protein
MVLRPGEGVNGSDRLIMTWADNAIPNTRWLLVALLADNPPGGEPLLGLPVSDFFIYGLAIGEVNGDFMVTSQDQLAVRSHPRNAFNPAPIDFIYDINRDGLVTSQDELMSRSHPTNAFNALKVLSWPAF